MTTPEEKVEAVWERMNESERFGARFALLPGWTQDFDLSKEEMSALMKKAVEPQ